MIHFCGGIPVDPLFMIDCINHNALIFSSLICWITKMVPAFVCDRDSETEASGRPSLQILPTKDERTAEKIKWHIEHLLRRVSLMLRTINIWIVFCSRPRSVTWFSLTRTSMCFSTFLLNLGVMEVNHSAPTFFFRHPSLHLAAPLYETNTSSTEAAWCSLAARSLCAQPIVLSVHPSVQIAFISALILFSVVSISHSSLLFSLPPFFSCN